MTDALIAYDEDLPEVPGRVPWEPPTSYLVKDVAAPSGWRVDDSGRRPSRLLVVSKIREAVDAWRARGYEGGSEVTRRLFEYWFDEDHEVLGFDAPFRYYYCQREAIETLAWLVEVDGRRDTKELIEAHGAIFQRDLISKNLEFQTNMDGRRQIRRYVPESDSVGVQDIPPKNLPRFAIKMATGSGKTWVMAMALVWCYFHKQLVPDSRVSTNFLIVAPNVIVYQRLEKDFSDNRIFHKLPLIPPEWRGSFSQKVILRGEVTEPDPSGNLFLTNIHQLYESREPNWTPANAVDALLGKKPAPSLSASGQRSMLERVKSLSDLVVMNDEAHHVHDESLAWSKSLLTIHQNLPSGISAWFDFSATPRDQNGMYFPWTVCDYPLAQAVEDRIVKAPLIVTNEDDPNQPAGDPSSVKKANVVEKYGYWIHAAVTRWKDHQKAYKALSVKPVLFIMTEKNLWADAIGEYLSTTEEFGFEKSEILVIHTDSTGEVRPGDIDRARQEARDIDRAESRIKVIVSVLMLREGWDVRNVTVVLGLRPFTAKSEILPEQVIGRGLRLMSQVSPDRTQTLEVLGTQNLLDALRHKLEAEGVGVVSVKQPPPPPITIEPVRERLDYDIAIPIPTLSLTHNVRKLSGLDVNSLDAILDREDIDERYRMRLRMDFAPTETQVHQADITMGDLPPTGTILAGITNKVIKQARLPNRFAELYPAVQSYVLVRCFGRQVDPDDDALRSHLNRPELQEGIAGYLAAEIGNLTVERRPIEFEKADFRLSRTRPFTWRRDLPPLEARKTVFNFVATYNSFERQFAEFLDQADDVLRFAALGTTEQGSSGTAFRVDYLKPSGAIGFYYPDWAVIQQTDEGEVNWIIETKGRVWEGTEQKDAAMRNWCQSVSRTSRVPWRYIRVNQVDFKPEAATLRELVVMLVGKAMFAERDQRRTTMSRAEIRRAREEGRA